MANDMPTLREELGYNIPQGLPELHGSLSEIDAKIRGERLLAEIRCKTRETGNERPDCVSISECESRSPSKCESGCWRQQ